MEIEITDVRVIEQGDRLFRPVNDFMIVTAAILQATSLFVEASTHKSKRPGARLDSKQGDRAIVIPLRSPLEHALADTLPDRLEIGFVPNGFLPDEPHEKPPHKSNGFRDATLSITSMLYLSLFERQVPWLTANVSTDRNKWGPIPCFGRMLRNAAAHEGRLSMDNPNTPAVSWKHLTYGPPDNGRQILGGDLNIADLLFFMFDLSDELDRLGAPHL